MISKLKKIWSFLCFFRWGIKKKALELKFIYFNKKKFILLKISRLVSRKWKKKKRKRAKQNGEGRDQRDAERGKRRDREKK